jgi:chromosome segregation ATPase
MNFEQKYLKYKEKYLELKAILDGGLVGNAVDSDKKIKNKQKASELYNRNIKVLEQAVIGRTNKIKNSEDQKNRGLEKLKKNNAPVNEIDEFIKSMDSEINDIKKDLENKKKLLEKEKAKLNKLS